MERLHSKIETGIFKIEKTKLVAIGVPQYVKELHKFDELHHRLDAMEEKFWGPFGSCRQSLVVSEIFDHIQVNGAVAPYFCRPSSEPALEARLVKAIANQARILRPTQHDQDQLPDVDPDTFAP